MNYWYCLNLGDGISASMPSAEIEDRFQKSFMAAGNPPEMAVFTRSEEGRLHCEVIAYFSPAAVSVAEKIAAAPCTRPVCAGLSLLAGDEKAWSVLFPENSEETSRE
jgi:hypothetical protein